MTEQDRTTAPEENEPGTDASSDDQRYPADEAPVSEAPDRRDREWAKSLWLSVVRGKDIDSLPRSARA